MHLNNRLKAISKKTDRMINVHLLNKELKYFYEFLNEINDCLMNILSYIFLFFVLCSIKISFNNLFIVSFFFYKNQRREIKSYHQKFLFLIFLSFGMLAKIYKFVLFSYSFFSFFYN